ncbi:unnamed protein product [Prorocentrum cordatum]|uniref:HECT domain-containing protein n=1 Tax=Prorocentrum cordatum TaxID=2364126 RepID=A0ABN9VW23_9DINO|nr:unnamed protein product [Polarella glacialis]
MALALLHCVQLPMHFSSLSWKLLLGQPIAASDIESADPHFFRNRVAAVLRPGGVEEMAAILGEPLRFASAPGPLCAEEVELVPGGLLRLVTEDNNWSTSRGCASSTSRHASGQLGPRIAPGFSGPGAPGLLVQREGPERARPRAARGGLAEY